MASEPPGPSMHIHVAVGIIVCRARLLGYARLKEAVNLTFPTRRLGKALEEEDTTAASPR